MPTRDEDVLLRLAEAVAQGTPVDWARELAAQPELRPELEQLRALEAIAALPRNAAPDPLIGRTLSHYRIRERLGAGGMGVVYRAEDQRLHRPVALKVLPPELVASEERRRSLLREARAGAAVVHPSVAAVHEVGEAEGTVFVAMELVEGETLQERIAGRPLPLRAALGIAIEMADGLAHAHQAHVIHRDLKPANVVIRPDGHVKILDFGLAKLSEQEKSGASERSRLESLTAEATREGWLLGTPAYMSPEQVRGEPLDARSDLFSFGSTLYEMLTGQAPFRGASPAETLTAILRDEPTPASRLHPELPPRLEEILGRCLAKDPAQRYPGASDLAADLRALASGPAAAAPARSLEVSALSAPGGELRASPRRAWLPLAAGVALLLAAALFWGLGRAPSEGSPGHSLAVLPFVNMSADPEQEYFADGIAEEILNTLARFEGLRVVGRTSSFSFRDSDADLKTIGQALGADVILEGSVRTAGHRVRITAQLIDAGDGIHRWSETYDRELEDIFAIQTEIATAISTALRLELSSEQRQRLATPPTQNLDAYRAYLLGRQRYARFSTATTEEAIRYFERAIEFDPTFALAHAGLAQAYLELVEDSGLPPDEMMARAQAAADKALELDDRLAEAHAALGAVKWFGNDVEGAEAAYQRALALNPDSVDGNLHYGYLLGRTARYPESVALFQKAVEMDPLSLEAVNGLGQSLLWLGRFDEGFAWLERALEIDPQSSYALAMLGKYHWLVTGRLDEAVVWWAKVVTLDPRSLWALGHLGRLFLELGAPDRAEYWIDRAIALAPENVDANIAMQRLAVLRGDQDAALHHGRKAFPIWPLDAYVLSLLRDHELGADRYEEARALYEPLFPELLSERDPEVDLRNYRAAIDLALILSRTGEQERADLLLERSLEQIQRRPRLGEYGYGIADVQIYALQGKKQKALSALRQAIDAGWRRDWWYQLHHKPDLEPLHGEPEFQAMLEEVRADMAAQLERVRELERRGELVLAAEPTAPSDPRLD